MSEFLLYLNRDELFQRIEKRCYHLINTKLGSPCWIFEGHDDGKGYKKISILGRAYYVHRIMYILSARGPHLKPRHDLDHICMQRACCNPWHMNPLTRLTHNRKTHKGRKKCHSKILSSQAPLQEACNIAPTKTAALPSGSYISANSAPTATSAADI